MKGVLLGLAVVGVGVVMYRHAYAITRFGEQIDAIGSTRAASGVEPASRNVLITKGIAVLCFIVGGMFIAGGVWA